MDNWERFNETSLPDKKAFYSELYLEDTIDEDYTHVQKVFEELKLQNLGDYTIFMVKAIYYYLQMYSKTLETSVLKYMNLILLIFLSAPGLAWQACLNKDRNKIRIINQY